MAECPRLRAAGQLLAMWQLHAKTKQREDRAKEVEEVELMAHADAEASAGV